MLINGVPIEGVGIIKFFLEVSDIGVSKAKLTFKVDDGLLIRGALGLVMENEVVEKSLELVHLGITLTGILVSVLPWSSVESADDVSGSPVLGPKPLGSGGEVIVGDGPFAHGGCWIVGIHHVSWKPSAIIIGVLVPAEWS